MSEHSADTNPGGSSGNSPNSGDAGGSSSQGSEPSPSAPAPAGASPGGGGGSSGAGAPTAENTADGPPAGPASTGSASAGPGANGSSSAQAGDGSPGDGGDPERKKRRRRRRRKPGGGDGDASSDPADAGAPSPTGDGSVEAKGVRRRRRRGKVGGDSAAERPARAKGGGKNARSGKGPGARRGGERGRREPHHALIALQSLGEMVRDLLQVEGIELLDMPRYVDVKLQIPLDVKRDGKVSASRAVEQILARVKEVREHESAVVPGSVYCYFSESAETTTSRPQGSRDVFDGYESTGRPIFTDFVTMSIERKHDGIDALLAGEDIVLTHISLGRVLRTQQLAVFGKSSPVYRILGQVDAGLFQLLNSPKQAAFSFQLLRGTSLEGKPRLRLHAVGAADLMDLADPSIVQILHRFQQRLNTESLRLAGKLSNDAELDEEEFVLPLLQDLAKQLSGRHKRRSRRTAHADERSAEGQRPTTKAYSDAEGAGDSHLYIDDFEGTIIVLGSRGRVHVFTNQAKHVTSMVMNGSSVQQRQRQGRWRKAEPEERGEFRVALKRAIARGENETADTSVSPTPPVLPGEAAIGNVPAATPTPAAASDATAPSSTEVGTTEGADHAAASEGAGRTTDEAPGDGSANAPVQDPDPGSTDVGPAVDSPPS